jgi:hypothetical protein
MSRMRHRRQSVWKSKKGGIPVINEVVLTILHSTPKPVLFLLFLFLMSVIGNFALPSVLNMFGYECVSKQGTMTLYQVPMDKIFQKSLSDIKQDLRALVGLTDYQLPDDPFPNGDKSFLRVPAECFLDVQINGSTFTGYSSACVNCTKSGVIRYWGSICLSDGYYSPDLITKYWLGTANFCYKCSPPDPYYYDHEYCFSEENCFFRITDESLIGQIVDEDYEANYYYQQIVNLGGVEIPQDTNQFVNVQCEDVNKPQLYFFNIKIFDLQLWIYLAVAYILIFIAYHWYRMSGMY